MYEVGSVQEVRENTQKGGNEVIVKRLIYLVTAALVFMVVLMPAALAQDMVPGDDNPHLPEPNAVVVGSHQELQQVAGQPLPAQAPTQQHPDQVPAAPTQEGGLPTTGGPSVILPAAAMLLLSSGVLAYASLRKHSR